MKLFFQLLSIPVLFGAFLCILPLELVFGEEPDHKKKNPKKIVSSIRKNRSIFALSNPLFVELVKAN